MSLLVIQIKNMGKKKFYVVVDTALSSLDERFQTLEEVNGKFGALLNFPNMSKEELPEYCQTLSTALSHDGQPDINAELRTFHICHQKT